MSERFRVAGYRPTQPQAQVTVDYADVLRQAVDNERWRVLREVRTAVERIKTMEPSTRNSYSSVPRGVVEYARDVSDALAAIEAKS